MITCSFDLESETNQICQEINEIGKFIQSLIINYYLYVINSCLVFHYYYYVFTKILSKMTFSNFQIQKLIENSCESLKSKRPSSPKQQKQN